MNPSPDERARDASSAAASRAAESHAAANHAAANRAAANRRYDNLPEPPAAEPHAAALLARLVDGLAFRYRWASDGLRPEDLGFRPAPDAMDLGQLLAHLAQLASWMSANVAAARDGGSPVTYPAAGAVVEAARGSPEQLVTLTLDLLHALRSDVLALGDGGLLRIRLVGGREPTAYPVWNLLNGPLADALTHVGQLATWRRMLGRPVPQHDVFRGRGPS